MHNMFYRASTTNESTSDESQKKRATAKNRRLDPARRLQKTIVKLKITIHK